MGGSRNSELSEDDGVIGAGIVFRIFAKIRFTRVLDVVSSGDEAIQISSKEHPDLVLMDIILEGIWMGLMLRVRSYRRF